MQTKICYKCKLKKAIREFWVDNKCKDKLNNTCIKCKKLSNNAYNKTLKQTRSRKKYYLSRRNEIIVNVKQHRLLNLDKIKQTKRRYYLSHKDEIISKAKQYYIEHSTAINLQHKQYTSKHIIEGRVYHNKYEKQRKKIDPGYKLLRNYRSRLRAALFNNKKASRTISLLMCDIPFFKLWIEIQWLPGMTWANYGYGKGKWNIHHIIACSFFNLLDPVEQYMCFRYQNTQPMWQTEHFAKSDKINLVI